MNISKIAFDSIRVAFGLGHFALQTSADLVAEAESHLIKHTTGIWDSKSQSMVKVTERNRRAIVKGRKAMTTKTQKAVVKMSKEQFDKARVFTLKHRTV